MSYLKPMLCQEIEVNGYKEHGMDEVAVTKAYRKAIVEELKKLFARGFVAERKGYQLYEWNDVGQSADAVQDSALATLQMGRNSSYRHE